MESINSEFIQAVGSLGATGILSLILWLFVRGDILSRPVYEKMTERIVERVAGDISSRVVDGITQMLDEWEGDSTRKGALVQLEMEQLRREKRNLVQEMEWDNKHLKHLKHLKQDTTVR